MKKINRRNFLVSLTGCALAPGLPCSTFCRETTGECRRPNIIIILADDLGYGDLGCYGNRDIQTPHLDALAAGGVRFTDFHSSGAVCSPTRASLLTGRYQQRCGIPAVITARNHRDKGLSVEEITFAELLKSVGYITGIFGKWHLGYHPRFNPDKHGFDLFRGYVSGNVDYLSHVDQTGVADWWDNSKQITEEGYTTHLITQHAIRFMEDNKEHPFCLYVAHEAPHYPYQGRKDEAERTVGGEFSSRGSRKDVAVAYKEMVEEMDKGIGRIVDTLKRLGLERNTFIFFFSDNGANKNGSNGVLRGFKGSLWEGGHRVPAIAYWPGKIAPGQTCGETTISLDLFPTSLALGNAAVPEGHKIDGVNLLPLLVENKSLGERSLFWAYRNQKAVRQGSWKLVVSSRNQGEEIALFNLDDDISEKMNLAGKEPKRVRALLDALAAWEKEVTPMPVTFW